MSSHRLLIENLTVPCRGVPALHHVNLDLRCGRGGGLGVIPRHKPPPANGNQFLLG